MDILFEETSGSGGAILFIRDGVLASLEILAPAPLDFHVRKVRFERMLEHPTDPEGEPQFVVVDRRTIDQIAANIQEAREREKQRGITTEKLTLQRPSVFVRPDSLPCPGWLMQSRLGLQLRRGR